MALEYNLFTVLSLVGIFFTLLAAALINFFLSNRSAIVEESNSDETNDKSTDSQTRVKVVSKKKTAHEKKSEVHHHPLNLNTLKGHGDSVTGISFSFDGKSLASACEDNVIRIFKLENVESPSFKFYRVNLPPAMNPKFVFFEQGENFLVSGSHTQGNFICKFRAATENNPAKNNFEKNNLDKKREVEKNLKPPEIEWEVKKIQPQNVFLQLSGAVHRFDNAEKTKFIYATCTDGTEIALWQSENGHCIKKVDTNQLKNTMAKLSPDARFLASAAFTADVKIWEILYEKNGNVKDVVRVMDLKGHKSAVTWLDFSFDNQKIITASKDGTIKIWNINVRYHLSEDPKCIRSFSIPHFLNSNSNLNLNLNAGGHKNLLDRISISPDDKFLAVSKKNVLEFIDCEDGRLVESINDAHEGFINCLSWSPRKFSTRKGEKFILATASVDKKIKLWASP